MAVEKKVGPFNLNLVENYHQWKTWWSLKLNFIASCLMSAIAFWPSLPLHAQAALPSWTLQALAFGAIIANALSGGSRFIAQTPKDGPVAKTTPTQ